MRVTALEKELHSLRSRLEGTGDATNTPSPLPLSNQRTLSPANDPQISSAIQQGLTLTASHTDSSGSAAPDPYDEISGLDFNLDEMTQQSLFSKFKRELSPHMPFMYFEDDMTARQLRQQQQPALLDAILAASAASLYAPLSQGLASWLEKEYAERIIVKSEKFIENCASSVSFGSMVPISSSLSRPQIHILRA